MTRARHEVLCHGKLRKRNASLCIGTENRASEEHQTVLRDKRLRISYAPTLSQLVRTLEGPIQKQARGCLCFQMWPAEGTRTTAQPGHRVGSLSSAFRTQLLRGTGHKPLHTHIGMGETQ
jgi:hypothetical protein